MSEYFDQEGLLSSMETYTYDEYGNVAAAESWDGQGNLLGRSEYTYYNNSWPTSSMIVTNGAGVVTGEWYYDENGQTIGQVTREEDGTLGEAWGTDLEGNDLTELPN